MKHFLGNERDAKFIRDWYLLMCDSGREAERPPSGFERLGSGCHRTAFLHIKTNTVYKVQHEYGSYSGQSNVGEYRQLRSGYLKRCPEGIRLPKYELYALDGKEVSAMEYLPNLLRDMPFGEEKRRYERAVGRLSQMFPHLWDTHGGNVAIDDQLKVIVPIDLGGDSSNC